MNLQKLAGWIAGYGSVTAVSVAIDDVLWPAIVFWFGPWQGGIIMTIIALVINLAMIWAYDLLKLDLFAFETLREFSKNEKKGILAKIVTKIMSWGKIPAYIAISFYDPFLSVIYMRRDVGKYQMEWRDWGFFFLSMFIACAGWTTFWHGAVVVGQTITNLFV